MDADEPKKYIRTLAGDMDILKKGGTPELAPLETYASDFSDKIKDTNASPVTVLAAEQDAITGTPQPEQKPQKKNTLYVIAGVLLIAASGFSVYFAYVFYSSGSAPVVSEPVISAPIFVDEREQISGTGAALLQAIKQSINRPLASGAVRLLYTATATTTNNSIFSALQEPAPNILLRNINAANSMAGIANAGGIPSPFFILSVASYSNTFSGMLSWEPTMPRDLIQLFPSYAVASTTATTTIAGFRDEVVSNHDVRMYRDTAGRSILLYGYWNQMTLIIARDPTAFAEILGRLATSLTQ